MQFNAILAVLIAATGVVAAPSNKPSVKKPVVVINKPVVTKPQDSNNVQTITCNGGSPYCCMASTDAGGKNIFKCETKDSCNQIITCCNNQGSGSNKCNAFGNSPVVFVDL
ncbi:hypothetical protein F66182_969 [Fusarium sp. NRRL 66182]|nr:hypothetical protein F66182_969 [Fusarium sp. NRRL 66182]